MDDAELEGDVYTELGVEESVPGKVAVLVSRDCIVDVGELVLTVLDEDASDSTVDAYPNTLDSRLPLSLVVTDDSVDELVVASDDVTRLVVVTVDVVASVEDSVDEDVVF